MRPHLAALALSLCLAAAPAPALEIEGIRFAERQKVAGSELQLNGGGLRNRYMFKVYAMALYLPAKSGEVETVLNGPGPKRIAIVTLRDLTAKQFSDALRSGIDKNHDNEIVAALAERMNDFAAALETVGETASSTRIDIDWLPEAGTRLSVAGKPVGKEIAGEDFYRALLRIWLGRRPAQADLRDGLLGKAK